MISTLKRFNDLPDAQREALGDTARREHSPQLLIQRGDGSSAERLREVKEFILHNYPSDRQLAPVIEALEFAIEAVGEYKIVSAMNVHKVIEELGFVIVSRANG